MSDQRYIAEGKYLSARSVMSLNERHGWFTYGDAQSDVSRAFANNSVHAFLESAKEAQQVLQVTGLTPRQLMKQRQGLLEALKAATDALAGGLWDYGPGQDEHEKCNEVIESCRALMAKATQ